MSLTEQLIGCYQRFADRLSPQYILRVSLVVAVVVGALVYLLAPPQYSADSTVLLSQRLDTIQSLGLSPMTANPLGAVPGLSMIASADPMEKWTTALVQSRTVRQELVDKFKLQSALAPMKPQDVLIWLGDRTLVKGLQKGIAVGGNVGLRIVVVCPGPPRLLSWLGIRKPFDTSTAQKMAANLANEYLAVVVEQLVKSNTGAASDLRTFITKREKQVSTELARVEDELQQLRAQFMLMEPVGQAAALGTRIGTATEELARIKAAEQEASQSLQTARRGLSRQQAQQVTAEVKSRNPLIVRLETESADMRVELAAARASGKGPEHPEVIALQRSLEENESQLENVASDVLNEVTRGTNPVHEELVLQVAGFEIKAAGLQASRAERSRQLAQASEEFATLPAVARRYGELERERLILAEVLTTLRRRLEVAAIEERQDTTAKLQLLDPAIPPTEKSGPSTSQAVIASFLLSVLLLGAVWAHRRDLIFGVRPEQPADAAGPLEKAEDGS